MRSNTNILLLPIILVLVVACQYKPLSRDPEEEGTNCIDIFCVPQLMSILPDEQEYYSWRYFDYDTLFTILEFSLEDSIEYLDVCHDIRVDIATKEEKEKYIELGFFRAEHMATKDDMYGYVIIYDSVQMRKNLILLEKGSMLIDRITHYIDTSLLLPMDSFQYKEKYPIDGCSEVVRYQIIADSLIYSKTFHYE